MDQKRYEELRAYLKIDMGRIDEELMEHPQRLEEASAELAHAIKERESAEQQVKLVEAQAADEMRRKNDKISEAAIKTKVPLDEEYITAKENYTRLQYEAALWAGVVDAYRAKTSAMKHLSELMVSGYITQPAVREAQRAEMHEKRRARLARG